MAVPVEIIHFVGIDGAGDDGMEYAVNLARIGAEVSGAKADDVIGIDVPGLAQDVGQGSCAAQVREVAVDDAAADFFVPGCVAAFEVESFEAVREGIMADVMEQAGSEYGEEILFGCGGCEGGIAQKLEEIPLNAAENAEAVFKTRVDGAGIDEMGGAEHADAAQALKSGMVDDFEHARRERNVAAFGNAQAGGGVGAQAEFGQGCSGGIRHRIF